MDRSARVYVAGGGTFLGGAIARRLTRLGFSSVIAEDPDFGSTESVDRFFASTRPEYVFVSAGRTAGIAGNAARPVDLMLDSLLVATHLLPAAWRCGVRRLLYVASSCAYPKEAPQPLHASALWTGPLEPTSAAYATAKLAGIGLCQAYRQQHGASFVAAIPADAYGPGDDFRPDHSHVAAALVRRIVEARHRGVREVEVWGTGTPRREFIYIDDLADACIFAIRQYDDDAPINLGTGVQTSIAELAETIREVTGYEGQLRYERSRPDGMPFKGLDSTVLRQLGWKPQWTFRQGLEATCRWFEESGH